MGLSWKQKKRFGWTWRLHLYDAQMWFVEKWDSLTCWFLGHVFKPCVDGGFRCMHCHVWQARRMKDITKIDLGPFARMKCECGRRFWVDALTEENLFWLPQSRELVAQCPKCGMVDSR